MIVAIFDKLNKRVLFKHAIPVKSIIKLGPFLYARSQKTGYGLCKNCKYVSDHKAEMPCCACTWQYGTNTLLGYDNFVFAQVNRQLCKQD